MVLPITGLLCVCLFLILALSRHAPPTPIGRRAGDGQQIAKHAADIWLGIAIGAGSVGLVWLALILALA